MDNTKNNQVELEFSLNTPPTIVFQRLSTPHGLSEWFADNVNLAGNVFTFFWDDDMRQAELIESQKNKMVKFKWLNTESLDHHLTFELVKDEMTGDLSLHVTEDIDEHNEVDEAITLWNHQIGELKRVLGA